MKRFLFVFAALCAAFCSADAFARALCPDGMTQKQCCTKDGAYDYVDAKTICGLGNIQDSNGYYADCYVCGSSLIQPSTGCGMGCAKCTGSYCKTCESGFYMKSGKCFPCEFIPVENGTCKACTSGASCDAVDCNIGYKTVGTTCVKVECPLNCAACDSWGFCYQCESGYTLSDDRLSCLPSCPENCKTCSNGVCTDCNDGYTLNNGKCIDCSIYNVGNGTCTACDEYGCTDAECNGSNAFFNPTFRKCGAECDVNQYLDSSYTCRDCPAGQTSPGGWFANPTNCYSCDSIPVDGGRCTECKNGSCTKAECEDGYVLDSTGRTCIAALASCLSPLKISDDGCCCVK